MSTPDAERAHFTRHGWVLVRDLLAPEELRAVRDDLFRIVPSPEDVASDSGAAGVTGYTEARRRDPGSGRAFRPDQYLGLAELPFDRPRVDRVPFHPSLIGLAESLLETPDIRLYQAEVYAKYHGVTDYEQPLHVDFTNHALLPPRPRGHGAAPAQIQLFLYLADVDAGNGPPHVVSRQHTHALPLESLVFGAPRRAEIDPALEVPAIAPAGSALVYASDVAHRGTAIARPGAARFTFNLGYRRADADWAGGSPFARKGLRPGFRALVEACTPRQLGLLGFPAPGDAYWTDENLALTAERYPGLDLGPWRRRA